MSPGKRAASMTEGIPTWTSGIANCAVSTAIRRSQHAAISRPAPRHRPLMRAITGTGKSCRTAQHRCKVEIKVCADAWFNSRISRISAPPTNARDPIPVTTRARIDSSFANASTDRTNALAASVSITWRPLSESSVSQATDCSRTIFVSVSTRVAAIVVSTASASRIHQSQQKPDRLRCLIDGLAPVAGPKTLQSLHPYWGQHINTDRTHLGHHKPH